MVKKKKEEKEEKPQEKKTIKKSDKKEVVVEKKDDVEKFPILFLLEKNSINELNAFGFLNFYGLSEDFKKEFETGEAVNKFSEEEFEEMYERYIKREI